MIVPFDEPLPDSRHMKAEDIQQALQRLASPSKAKSSSWFFRTGPGQYGEGDQFIGVTVPEQREVAASFASISLLELMRLLQSPIHEHRLTALFILVDQYKKGDTQIKKEIVGLYHKNRAQVNNWDLVDSSAPYILGDWLLTHSPEVLYRLASSKSVWDRRIAIIATLASIKNNQFDPTLKIATLLLPDKEDLIHKATGWALREVGKKDQKTLINFLDRHAKSMPRTSLRYAIERLSTQQRLYYLKQKTSGKQGLRKEDQ
ncbi:MAG TPA: DNA alkylation repair protein [Candidatus Saccharimonadales bacterium]|nr:DNA alkylation repair protein [Candidatus Saccharimonadales bacterium]